MDVNQKMLLELANQLGIDDNNDSKIQEAANFAEQYKGKSEQEMLMDILRLKKDYRSDPAQFKKQMQAIKTLRSFMNREQQEKLDQVLSMLERD